MIIPKKNKFISYLTGCLLSVCILIPQIANAQVTAFPMVLELESKRGKSKGSINIKNEGNAAFRARVYAAPFTYNKNGFESLESSPKDLTPYLTFSPRELVVQPGQTRTIRVVSRFLPSMAQGEYRAVIFTENLQVTETKKGSATIGIVPRIGMTVYARHGELSPNFTVKDVRLNPENKQIQLLVKNSGEATGFPQTNWILTQGETQIGKGKVSDTTVIAEGERYITISTPFKDKQISAGSYQLSGDLIWGEKRNKLPFEVDLTISPEQAAAANKPKPKRQK